MNFEPLLSKLFSRGVTSFDHDFPDFFGYRYATEMGPEKVIEVIREAGLRGRGGAGFPTAVKWDYCRKASGSPKYLVCNADESEPGTFKDVQIMMYDPHALFEGIGIAAYAIGARQAYIYVRGEFDLPARIMELRIAKAHISMQQIQIFIHRGAGAYICGEETALLDSIEGRRGEPRLKPPYPAECGLWGKPTVINNVETLTSVSKIFRFGLDNWKAKGTPKLYCISGDIINSRVFEAPLGIKLRDIVYNYGGGPLPGRKVQAVFPGGSSTAPLRDDELDIPMDFKMPDGKPGIIGSAGTIVVDDSRCMVDVARNIMRFYAHESCGKCTPCRDGNALVHDALNDILEGRDAGYAMEYIERMIPRIFTDCFCPLAKGAMNALGAIFTKWRADFESHVFGSGCGRKRIG